ncbi:hypothetical protein BROUX41_004945 [Berkeleyomyces rouxiae]|uniref:uncharacterized protein n=1 Tax=Berkeleyomyces rouxiae TaxID=2035830 RepID=UPI003B79E348
MDSYNFCDKCSSLVQDLGDEILAKLETQPMADLGADAASSLRTTLQFDDAYPTRSDDANSSCSFCLFLLQNVVQMDDGQPASEEVQVKVFHDAENGTFCLDFDLLTANRDPENTYQIYQCALNHPTATQITPGSPQLASRGDNSWVIQDIHRELKATSHEVAQKKFLPKRLLSIQDYTSSGNLHLKLRDDILTEIGDAEVWPHYATLSYSWGNSAEAASAQLKTTHETFDEHMQGVPFERLPDTVKDAVTVCSHLGIPYLWVDALCIIQNDREDWEQEGSQMALIYKFSFVTVCAANTTSCHQSFLDRGRLTGPDSSMPTLINIPLISSSNTSEIKGYLSIRKDSDEAKTLETQYMHDIDRSHWASRGWVFQEQCLSRRLIIFGASYVYFKSPSRVTKLEGINQAVHQERRPAFTEDCDKSNLARSATQWYSVAQRYQNKGLTVASDKLPALSGLASEFSYIMGFPAEEFFAGAWKQTFITDISWEQEGPQHDLSALIERLQASAQDGRLRYPASGDGGSLIDRSAAFKSDAIPSWSWMRDANQGGDCWWMPDMETYQICPEGIQDWEAHTAVSGVNPFGAIINGYIILRGKLLTLSSCLQDMYIKSQERNLVNLQYERSSLAFIWVKFDGMIGDHDIQSLYLLPLIQSPIALDVSQDEEAFGVKCDSNNLRGLVLHKASDPNLYVRVGTFHSTSRCSLKYKCMELDWETVELR